MPRPQEHRQSIAATADAQHGLITAAQLAEIGVRPRTTSRRSAGGMWTRVLPGVHLVDGGHPTRIQRERATLLYAGLESRLTGLTALRWYGVRALSLQETAADEAERPEPVHVLIPHERRRASAGFVVAERTRRMPPTYERREGLALTSIDRAVGDACRRLRRQSDATALVTEVLQRGLVALEALEQECVDGQMRGSALFRSAVGLGREGARSVPEGDLVQLLSTAGIPAVIVNARLVDSSGAFVAIADVWLDDVGIAIEVDSVEHHSGGEGFERTIRRNARYAAAGVPVVTLLPVDLRDRPGAVLRTVSTARSVAAGRRRPDVRVTGQQSPTAGRKAWRWGA